MDLLRSEREVLKGPQIYDGSTRWKVRPFSKLGTTEQGPNGDSDQVLDFHLECLQTC